jgi:hypothetical protein
MTKTQIAQYATANDAAEGDEDDLEGEAAESIGKSNSVVKSAYKRRYAEREAAMTRRPKGVSRKALARSTGDWLAVELAKLVLDEKSKLVVARYEAILDANGIAHSQYKREGKGWEGRLRMSTRLALQRVVAEDGELVLADGATIAAPRAWCAKHQH